MSMKKLTITIIAILTIGGSALALRSSESTTATEKTPLVAQVENHEERIGGLEVKTDETQTQTNQNTADITAVQEKTSTPPAPRVQPVVTPVAQPQPTTQPVVQPPVEPEPQPEVDPYTITAVSSTPTADKYGNSTGWTCVYTLAEPDPRHGKTVTVNNGPSEPCWASGSLLPNWLRSY